MDFRRNRGQLRSQHISSVILLVLSTNALPSQAKETECLQLRVWLQFRCVWFHVRSEHVVPYYIIHTLHCTFPAQCIVVLSRYSVKSQTRSVFQGCVALLITLDYRSTASGHLQDSCDWEPPSELTKQPSCQQQPGPFAIAGTIIRVSWLDPPDQLKFVKGMATCASLTSPTCQNMLLPYLYYFFTAKLLRKCARLTSSKVRQSIKGTISCMVRDWIRNIGPKYSAF